MSQPPADGAAPAAGEQASGVVGDGSELPVPAATGEAIDFAALVPRLETSLLRYVAQLLGRADPDAEDIVQDAFLRLHSQVHEHGDASVQNASTWLFRVAHNLVMDTLRKRKVRKQTHLKMAGQDAGASHPSDPAAGKAVTGDATIDVVKAHHEEDTLGELEHREACTLAMAELDSLPDNQRQALTLKMVQGLTIRQIAQVTDTSIGNVGYRISQGLAELSRRLKKAGVI